MRDRLKHLTKGVAIYGAGDAAISVVNFLLLAVYVKRGFLTAVDYGALATLGSLEAFIKVVNRWGLDGAFMRFYHEREDGAPRQRMASTILWFLLAADGVRARVVSMPCREWFDAQEASYRETVIPPTVRARVSVEAGVAQGWREVVGDRGRIVSLEHYGASADFARLYQEFGITAEAVAAAAQDSIRSATD